MEENDQVALSDPHDRFFRHVLGKMDIARGFFEHYLSQEVLLGLDMSTLSLTGESFVDESLKASQSDMVFSVRTAGNRSARLYLLLEHKSYPDPWVGLQLLGYVVRLWEREKRRLKRPPLPAVIPMVLYQGEGDWDIPQFGELFDQADVQAGYTVDFQYGRYMLDAERFDRIENNLELEIALHVLRYSRDERLPERLHGILSRFQQLDLRHKDAFGFLSAVLRYLSQASGHLEETLLQETLNKAFPAPAGESIMATLAQTWMQQGIEQGLEKGREQGREQGLEKGIEQGLEKGIEQGIEQGLEHERTLILRLAARKFDAETAERLSAFLNRIRNPEGLVKIADWIMDCDQSEELLTRIRNPDNS